MAKNKVARKGFIAKFAGGTCGGCKKTIQVGDVCRFWSRDTANKGIWHLSCKIIRDAELEQSCLCWAGLFTDPHSAAFFAYALVKRFSNTELDGTVEERNGIY